MSTGVRPSVLLIDDDDELLTRLKGSLEQSLAPDDVEVRTWMPDDGQDPREEFDRRVDDDTVLVVTDYDLTKKGVTGLFGVIIVSWCQARSIPSGDFSRGNVASLPTEPNLFEFRVPTDIDEAARYTAMTFRGFKKVRDSLASGATDLASLRSPAEALAAVLGRPHLEGQFALYMSRLGAANSSLLDRLRTVFSQNAAVNASEKQRLLAYVLGHVLANAVLRYPGPILSERALSSYVCTTEDEATALGSIFSEALYSGPFSSDAAYYWRAEVDALLERESAALGDVGFETSGEFNRAVVERLVQRPLALHSCTRCGGRNGGFLCPFTDRPVCERADCSVAANSWIPAGADLCRIERDFYDEWAPLLGL